jgi:hypothetical protein
VDLYSAGAFSDSVDETFDVILSGGAAGTQSGVSDGPRFLWKKHSFEFTVTDSTQPIHLKILATRGSTLSEDLLIDRVTVTSVVADDFAAWIAGFQVDGPTGFGEDADGDGVANGIENFFGTDPGVGNTGLTMISSDGDSVTFRHPQSATPASDVHGSYEWSLDLENWNDSGEMKSGTTVTITPTLNVPASGITTVTATATGIVPAGLFVRVKATQGM